MAEREVDPLKIVITSGATDVPIDEVRVISNISSGTTGALLAEAALERGHEVLLLRHKNAKKPFQKELTANPYVDDQEGEERRIIDELRRIRPFMKGLQDKPASEFDQYHKDLLDAVKDPSVDVAIISRAASDFGVEKVDGKISSDSDLSLTFNH